MITMLGMDTGTVIKKKKTLGRNKCIMIIVFRKSTNSSRATEPYNQNSLSRSLNIDNEVSISNLLKRDFKMRTLKIRKVLKAADTSRC